MAQVEEWWEQGPGTVSPKVRGMNHNLAVYGWDLRDTLERTADTCREETVEPKDNRFYQIVEYANERVAIRVLDSARSDEQEALTPLGAAAALGAEGTEENPQGPGIETLIVLLGANNALPSMLELDVKWSDNGYDELRTTEMDHKSVEPVVPVVVAGRAYIGLV